MLGGKNQEYELERDRLLAEIVRLQDDLAITAQKARKHKYSVGQLETELASRGTQIKTLQTLNLGLLSLVEEKEIYQLVCQSVVEQMGWDAALVIKFTGSRGVVIASNHVSSKQLTRISDHLSGATYFAESSVKNHALVTFGERVHDKTALQLRALFSAEEVAALPIQQGDHTLGYLVGVQNHGGEKHTTEDLEFLAGVALLVAHAVQQSRSYSNLEEQNLKLKQLDELKDSFISITSHQLRTPLSIIKWILSILQSDKKLADFPEQIKMIEQAYETNERLIRVVNDLLNVSRIQEGKLPFKPQLVHLDQMILEVINNTEPAVHNHDLHLTHSFTNELPQVQVDPILFKEAVQNVLENAIEYNLPHNGWIKIDMHEKHGGIELSISNSGLIIPPEDHEKIFTQFYRSPLAISHHPNGNGLGLYLAQEIAKSHHGNLECRESSAHQTVFTFTLPKPS